MPPETENTEPSLTTGSLVVDDQYITSDNEAFIFFDSDLDTEIDLSKGLEISIEGARDEYLFTWEAEYLDSQTIELILDFKTGIESDDSAKMITSFVGLQSTEG